MLGQDTPLIRRKPTITAGEVAGMATMAVGTLALPLLPQLGNYIDPKLGFAITTAATSFVAYQQITKAIKKGVKDLTSPSAVLTIAVANATSLAISYISDNNEAGCS